MNELCAALLNHISGEVRFDPVACALYSTDASIYEIKPLGVVMPKTRADIIAAVQLCGEHHVPLIARGGGTSQTGAALGRGMEKRVIHLQPSEREKLRKNWRWPKL